MTDEQKYGKSAKDAESDTGKAAESKGKDLGRDTRKDTGKEFGKEQSKDYGKDQGKDLGKDSGKEMGKEGMKCPERMVHEIKDQDHRTLRFYGKDDSGKETLWTEITYTRKPAMVK